jgi:Na+/melibiose symporter-like transporter
VQKAGVASGVLSMFRMVGGSLGVAVTGAIFQARVGASFEAASPQQFVDALGFAMTVCAGVALFGAAVGAVAIRAKKNNGKHRLTVEAAEADLNPGGGGVAVREAELETA